MFKLEISAVTLVLFSFSFDAHHTLTLTLLLIHINKYLKYKFLSECLSLLLNNLIIHVWNIRNKCCFLNIKFTIKN